MPSFRNRIRHHRLATVGAALIAGMLSTGAIASLSPDTGGLSSDPNEASDAVMITTVPKDQAAAFGILNRDPRQGDYPGTGIRGPFGANLQLARSTVTAAGRVWLVPANGHVCLRSVDKVGAVWACATTDAARSGDLVLSIQPEDPTEPATAIFAAVPDAYARATFSGEREQAVVAVQDNVASTTNSTATVVAFGG